MGAHLSRYVPSLMTALVQQDQNWLFLSAAHTASKIRRGECWRTYGFLFFFDPTYM